MPDQADARSELAAAQERLWSGSALAQSALTALHKRGLSEKTAELFGLGVIESAGSARLLIPVHDADGYLAGNASFALHTYAHCGECGKKVTAAQMSQRQSRGAPGLPVQFTDPAQGDAVRTCAAILRGDFGDDLSVSQIRRMIDEPLQRLARLAGGDWDLLVEAVKDAANANMIIRQRGLNHPEPEWEKHARAFIANHRFTAPASPAAAPESVSLQEMVKRAERHISIIDYMRQQIRGGEPFEERVESALNSFSQDEEWDLYVPCPFHRCVTGPDASGLRNLKIRPHPDGRQTWHCYGSCNKGGTLIDMVMHRFALTNQLEALAHLQKAYSLSFEDAAPATGVRIFVDESHAMIAGAESAMQVLQEARKWDLAGSDWRSCPHCKAVSSRARLAWLVGQHPKIILSKPAAGSRGLIYRKSVWRDRRSSRQLEYLVEGFADAWAMEEARFENVGAYNSRSLCLRQAVQVLSSVPDDGMLVICPALDNAGRDSVARALEALSDANYRRLQSVGMKRFDVRVVSSYGSDPSGDVFTDPAAVLKAAARLNMPAEGPKALRRFVESHAWTQAAWLVDHICRKNDGELSRQISECGPHLAGAVRDIEAGRIDVDALIKQGWCKGSTWAHGALRQAQTKAS